MLSVLTSDLYKADVESYRTETRGNVNGIFQHHLQIMKVTRVPKVYLGVY